MVRTRLTTILLALAAALALPGAAAAAEPLQWSLTPKPPGQPRVGTPYKLINDTGGRVGYGWRRFGVDLVWGGAGSWGLRRANPNDHRSVSPTEAGERLLQTVGPRFQKDVQP